MALPSSGAISFSAIAAHFGGSTPHSLSEWYPLVGLGVSGLPSSGTFNISSFHGKSNQVTVTNWVTSGYNQVTTSSGWTYSHTPSPAVGWTHWTTGRNLSASGMGFWIGGLIHTTATTYTSGNTRYVRAGEHSTDYDRWIRSYYVNIYTNTTTTTNTWIDTSGNVSSTTTVGI
tara:strand:+ start:1200 stop:1718 length:519 start_codon:yes stop_codon:yes gene_type:complete